MPVDAWVMPLEQPRPGLTVMGRKPSWRVWLLVLMCLWMPLAAQEQPIPTASMPTGTLSPGGFLWQPELAPQGPIVVLVSLPEQRAYVYRNGVRIGVSTVSTGRPGYETPAGVFTVLQKRREHYSNLYDNAPMPFMQRLTWSGIALHAGTIPGHPASHGCVRLPYAFAEQLFAVSTQGMTVVIAGGDTDPPSVTSPGLFTPVDPATGQVRASPRDSGRMPYAWTPEQAPDGPLTVVLSTSDREVVVMRNAIEIGRAVVELGDLPWRGTQTYVLLDGTAPHASPVVPDRPALRWLALPLQGQPGLPADDLRQVVASGQLRVPEAFARQVYDALIAGTTLVVTDESIHPRDPVADLTVLQADGAGAGVTSPAPAPGPDPEPEPGPDQDP